MPPKKMTRKKSRPGKPYSPAKMVESSETDRAGRIVAIGASAGGLEAFQELIEHLPNDSGLAFVLIQHLAPEQKSMLTEILSRSTTMAVEEITEGISVLPNHLYAMPPNVDLSIARGVLHLRARQKAVRHKPIDRFFASLADDLGADSIGVILSGADGDGTEGAKAIKAAGGITFAQDDSAKFEAMPRSAISQGTVDFVLAPAQIARKLGLLAGRPSARKTAAVPAAEDPEFHRIVELIRRTHKINLLDYKAPTVHRRIDRRMLLGQHDDLAAYVRALDKDPAEVEALYRDLLIGVTRFFREPEKITALKRRVFPAILKGRSPEDPIRIWVPGCSTGQEAYSLAIALHEHLGDMASNTHVQVFATDINDESIVFARAGVYHEGIGADVSSDRLQRFFTRSVGGYSVSKAIRSWCVFAEHDLLHDPPFSRLDLICCSNVLIYLQPAQQERVAAVFHYALKRGGFLMLGPSETLGSRSEGFTMFDKKQKVYRAGQESKGLLDLPPQLLPAGRPVPAIPVKPLPAPDPHREADRVLLTRLAPASVIVDDAMKIVEFRGDTQRFLAPVAGVPSFHLFKLVRNGLLIDLREAIGKAKKKDRPVRQEGIEVTDRESTRYVNIEVLPYQVMPGRERYFVVLFEEGQAPVARHEPVEDAPSRQKRKKEDDLASLRRELALTKNYLQATMADHDRANGDLRSATEELQSANEELQSTNEELETAKEELQSGNEELTTLNDELRNRNVELLRLSDDLINLLDGIDTPVIMVASDLRLRRFNPSAEKILNLVSSDLGRPITDFKPLMQMPDLADVIRQVIDTPTVMTKEVQDSNGRWYSLRVRPYRTTRKQIDGAVITLVDIHELRTLLGKARAAQDDAEQSRSATETARLQAVEANRSKDEFLSSISHELRTPMTSVLGWAQMMKMAPLDEATMETAIETIERGTLSQIRLIDDLLDISRMTTGKLRLDLHSVELEPLVGEILDAFRPAVEGKRLHVHATFPARAELVRADPDRMRQVIWNLLSNAIKFTPEEGTIEVGLDRDGSRIRVTVQDTGEGIDPDFLDRMFERFTQADSSSKRIKSGLGLGLAITKHLVELHGGTIRAESDGRGKGSRFTVSLPLPAVGPGSASLERRELADSESLPSLAGVRVLVVDDNADARELIQVVLEKCSAEPMILDSVKEALPALRRFRPHILISDIAMPKEDGYDLIRKVRRSRQNSVRSIPAIALTAYNTIEERDRILASGYERCLQKPIAPLELISAIAELTADKTSRSSH